MEEANARRFLVPLTAPTLRPALGGLPVGGGVGGLFFSD